MVQGEDPRAKLREELSGWSSASSVAALPAIAKIARLDGTKFKAAPTHDMKITEACGASMRINSRNAQ